MRAKRVPWWFNDGTHAPPLGSPTCYEDDTEMIGVDGRMWRNVRSLVRPSPTLSLRLTCFPHSACASVYTKKKTVPLVFWMPLDENGALKRPRSGRLVVAKDGHAHSKKSCVSAVRTRIGPVERVMPFSASAPAQRGFAILPYDARLRCKEQLLAVYFPNDIRGSNWYVGTVLEVRSRFVWARFEKEMEDIRVKDEPATHGVTWGFVGVNE